MQALLGGPRHGYAIAQRIRELSDDVLALGESSLYTSLQRLLLNGWVTAEWGASENNRRARYYTLTSKGRKHLQVQTQEFEFVVTAIRRVLRTA
jgi:transcriptional regulator